MAQEMIILHAKTIVELRQAQMVVPAAGVCIESGTGPRRHFVFRHAHRVAPGYSDDDAGSLRVPATKWRLSNLELKAFRDIGRLLFAK
jgi:hypothetical protein